MRIRLDNHHEPGQISTNDMGVARKQLDKVYRLDLSYQKRAEVPVEIAEMVNLTDLELHGNYFKDIDGLLKCCAHLPKLRYLTLDLHAHPELPASIGGLKSLQWLILSGSDVGPLPEEMGSLSSLKTLWLWVSSWAGKAEHLKPLGRLPLLRELNLEVTGRNVPLGMQYLDKVETLQTKHLPAMPPGIGGMAGLKIAELQFDSERAVNGVDLSEIAQLSCLESLKIKSHAVLHFPASLAGMQSLEGLDLENTRLAEIPPAIGTLPALKYLLLGENGISSLPDWLGGMRSLEGLKLDQNKLTELPASLRGASSLRRIGLEQNKFSEFPTVLLEMPSLRKVDLGRNVIKEFADVEPLALELEHISLRLNKLDHFPWTLARLPKAQLVMEGNPFCKAAGYKVDQMIYGISDAGHGLHKRQVLLALALGDMDRLAGLASVDDLLDALEDKDAKLRSLAQAALYRVVASPFAGDVPLPKAVRLLGPSKGLPQLEAWSKELAKEGIQLNPGKSVVADVVVLLEKPGPEAKKALAEGARPAALQHLAEFVEQLSKPWLKQKAVEQPLVVEQVWRLLTTGSDENIGLALGMLQGGGAPGDLLGAVVAISLVHGDGQMRKQAAGILEAQASAGLKAFLTAHKRNVGTMNDDKKVAHLQTLATAPDLDPHGYGRMLLALDKDLLPVFLPYMQPGDLELLRDREGYVRLRAKPLKALPTCMLGMQELEALRISFNDMNALPQGLEQLVQLKRLDLSDNSYTKLPNTLAGLQELEALYIGSNKLKEFPSFVLELPRLRVLEMGYNDIKAVPPALGEMRQLRSLCLESHAWKEFPKFIFKLVELRKLRLSRIHDSQKPFGPLPEELGGLKQLEDLGVEGHEILSVPDWMEEHRWKTLLLGRNMLRTLPEWICRQEDLEWLDIEGNEEIETLPAQIGDLRSLRSFDMSETGIAHLPASFGALQGLERLTLSRSGLQDTAANLGVLGELKGLKWLFCHDLPQGFANKLRKALPGVEVRG